MVKASHLNGATVNDKQVIGYSVVGVVALLTVGIWVVMKVTSATKPVQVVSAGTAPATKPTPKSQPPPPPKKTPEQIEIERLRTENQFLRQQAQQREQLLAQRSQRVADLERDLQQHLEQARKKAAAAQDAEANGPPTPKEIEVLGKQIAPLIEKRFWKIFNEPSKIVGSERDPKTKIEIKVTLESFDVVRTDSLITPIVGEIVLNSLHSS